ncbi:MAG: hypothetical protein LC794_06790 [Acidobacteria bacterium]|nr:hypothetical protein [Acidobacteriota bacterium]
MKRIMISLLFLSLLSPATLGQNSQERRVQAESKERAVFSDAELAAAQRREFAVSALISLAKEANSFNDLALRPRVLARAADLLWDADNVNARALFLRAWEAAEKGDAEEVTIKTKDNPPPMVIALRRLSGHDLRSEVLGLMASRDRTLGNEFLAKLKRETESKTPNSNSTQPLDNWSASDTDAKRLEIARRLLKEGLVEQALEIASPSLNYVNAKAINFLSELRTKNAEAADQRFSFLLSRIALDPSADANTVSGLSSYVFTPGFYITFKPEGGGTWTQPEQTVGPPNIPANLRDKFFQVGANILLRRLPPPDQDSSSAGRAGTINVIRRLLPLFEQYVPDTAVALRAHLTQLTGSATRDTSRNDNPLLTQGIRDEEPRDLLEGLQDRIDHAKTPRERDALYATAAVTLAARGDVKAHDFADKIDDPKRRSQVHEFIDLQLIQLAIGKKEASEAVRFAETGQLTHTQRAFAYTQAARILVDSKRETGLELLEKAADEAMRIENGSVDRAVLLVGIAMQLTTADRSRAWEIMGHAAKAANASDTFTGEDWIRFSVPSTRGVKTIGIGGEHFSLFRVFQLLAKDDLYRSIELTKSFRNDTPRATSILAIASAVLKETK